MVLSSAAGQVVCAVQRRELRRDERWQGAKVLSGESRSLTWYRRSGPVLRLWLVPSPAVLRPIEMQPVRLEVAVRWDNVCTSVRQRLRKVPGANHHGAILFGKRLGVVTANPRLVVEEWHRSLVPVGGCNSAHRWTSKADQRERLTCSSLAVDSTPSKTGVQAVTVQWVVSGNAGRGQGRRGQDQSGSLACSQGVRPASRMRIACRACHRT